MFRTGHVLDYPLRLDNQLTFGPPFPVLHETTPVRMDLTHSAWSDIFFLAMDYPEGARVLNISVDLAIRGSGQAPRPPVEAFFRVIDEPVLRLVSVDLQAQTDITALEEVFDFARDYLGLLKAAVIASGLIPAGLEGSGQSLKAILKLLTGRDGLGIELVSQVNDIPKGSRLAVSTNLLACLITVCMRATRQIRSLTGPLVESDRRQVAARAILGEWLGGSGGGWQDSGGVWPGVKLIEAVHAVAGDPEHGVSRGCLLPRHTLLDASIPASALRELEASLVVVHGGMSQDVGPILEMCTERYLLRSSKEWEARQVARQTLDDILAALRAGDIRAMASLTQRNYDGPIQTIIPWAANAYTQKLIERVRERFGEGFWGFWMLGGMSGGGMGFVFDPKVRARAVDEMTALLKKTKREMETSFPFGVEPVVYDFAINSNGTMAELSTATLSRAYYLFTAPALLRRPARELTAARRMELSQLAQDRGVAESLIERMLPQDAPLESNNGGLRGLLRELGFDPQAHERLRADYRAGRIGLAQNVLPPTAAIEDAEPSDLAVVTPADAAQGREALAAKQLAVVTMAGGLGTRWTKGAGVVKALHPFHRTASARYVSFLDIHFAKTRDAQIPHVVTTSYLTQGPIEASLGGAGTDVYLSPGRNIGLRMTPTLADLRYLWEVLPQQQLDEQKQKVRDSGRASLQAWVREMGEGADYDANQPAQCIHPVGHWYEVPNLLQNGVLARLLERHPGLQYLLLHNVDTLGATADPELLGRHIASGADMTVEVTPRLFDDHGGGLARVNGHPRLVEGLALPGEETEAMLTYYNTGTYWISIDPLLRVFGLTRGDLADGEKTASAVRHLAQRMPSYITIKDVKKRWGRGQEDIFPVAQFERLWGDMTALGELHCQYVSVPRRRGQQLKDVSQLDPWLRDGSAAEFMQG
jgi:galactokinase/mevalonate kinase-like predicted kinase